MEIISYYNTKSFVSPKVLYKEVKLDDIDTIVVNADPSDINLSGIIAGGSHADIFVPDKLSDCYLGKVAYSFITGRDGLGISYTSPSGVTRTITPNNEECLYWGFMDIDEVGVWKVGVAIGQGRIAIGTLTSFTALPSCPTKWALTYFNKYGLISTENRFIKVTETVDGTADATMIGGKLYPGMSNRKDTATLKFISTPLTADDRVPMVGLGRRPLAVHRIGEEPSNFGAFYGNAMASKVGVTLDSEVSPVTFELKGKFDYE